MTGALFEPITLRELEVRNRLWVPPMCQYSVGGRDGVPTGWHLMHYGSFARGGAGAIIVEANGVVPEGRISPEDLGLWNDTQAGALRRVIELVHAQGAAIGVQLAHAGRKGSVYREFGVRRRGSIPESEGGWQTVAPSAVAFPELAQPVALDGAGIKSVIAAFAAAAGRALAAGCDFVEIHAAHGYLLHEFLSPFSNQRDDEYGGSLANRARLLLEVVDAVRAAIGQRAPLLVRISATEWSEGGFDLDQAVVVSQWLREHSVDLIDVSSAGNIAGAEIPVAPGYQVPLATAIKQRAGIAVGAVGMLDQPFQAEQIVATELADVVLVGRKFLRSPSYAIEAARALAVDLPYIPPPYARAYRQELGRG